MSQIHSADTGPERRLLQLVCSMFPSSLVVKHPKDIPGKPDAWLPGLRIAVFADGCFFHSCPEHGHLPETNRTYWKRKLELTKQRDRRTDRELKKQGIIPVRIWEHHLGKNLKVAKNKLKRAYYRSLATVDVERLCSRSAEEEATYR